VYAASYYVRRHSLWTASSNFQGPWCIMGDFNAVLSAEGSKWGNPPHHVWCTEFSLPFLFLNLFTLGLMTGWGITRKLDRIFATFDCISQCKTCKYNALPRNCFDHHPLLLSISDSAVIMRPSSLDFLKCGLSMMICFPWLNLLGLRMSLAVLCLFFKRSYKGRSWLLKVGTKISLVMFTRL